jgi:hypothetical protein
MTNITRRREGEKRERRFGEEERRMRWSEEKAEDKVRNIWIPDFEEKKLYLEKCSVQFYILQATS